MKRVALGLLALAMAVVQAPSASATSINGKAVIDGIDSYSMTGISFINPGLVFTATADLMPLFHQLINLQDFTFTTTQNTTLFNVDGFDFTILTVMVHTNNSTFLNVTGTGMLTDTGFSPTAYDFTLTSTTLSGVTGYGLTLVPASAVPEPATLLLLGSGLLGLAGLLFRRAKKPNSALPC